MEYKVLAQVHYYNRELFALEIQGKYAFVYRGSGLNGGKIGRVLPFSDIKKTKPRGFSDEVLGYIYKEFFYRNRWVTHKKVMDNFEIEIQDFITHLEETLPEISPLNNEKITNELVYEKVSVIEDAVKGIKVFDWYSLVN